MREYLLHQPIDTYDKDDLDNILKLTVSNPNQLKIITLNPEMIVQATKNYEFQAAINNADIIIPDGTGITWAFKLLKKYQINRIPGIELAEKILQLSSEHNKSIAIYGGSPDILESVLNSFKEIYPGLNVVKAIDGYRSIEKDNEIAMEISLKTPCVVLVALGSPRQEIWINKNSHLFPTSIMIGIGGSLDIWSGKLRRAPKWMRDRGLEWLFRVINQPKRTMRILKSLPKFVWMVFKALLQRKQDF